MRLLLCAVLAFLLMMGDARWGITQPIRTVLSVFLYPVQMLALAPIELARRGSEFLQTRDTVQREAQTAREKLLVQSAKSLQVDQLLLENQRLRALIEMRERLKRANVAYRERTVPSMNLHQVFFEDPNQVTIELNYVAAEVAAT